MRIQQRTNEALDNLRRSTQGSDVDRVLLDRVLGAPVEPRERAVAESLLEATRALAQTGVQDLANLKAAAKKLEEALKTLHKAGVGPPPTELDQLEGLRGRVVDSIEMLRAAHALESALTIETKHADLVSVSQAAFEGGAISKAELSMLTDGGISGIIYRDIAAKLEVGRRKLDAIVKAGLDSTAMMRTDVETRIGLLSAIMAEMNKLVDRQVSSTEPIPTSIGGMRAGTLLRVVAHDKRRGHFVEDLTKALLAPATLQAEAKFMAHRAYQLALSQGYLVAATLGAALFASDRTVIQTAKLAYVIPSTTHTG